jgi:hypothetical protein
MSDPVSWLMIEPGWKVVSADGKELGHVDEVTGDSSNDIFNGLAVASGVFGKPKYVPAEQVARIVEGRVELALTRQQVDRLLEYEEPPESAQLSSEQATHADRIEQAVVGADRTRARPMAFGRRLLGWLRGRK